MCGEEYRPVRQQRRKGRQGLRAHEHGRHIARLLARIAAGAILIASPVCAVRATELPTAEVLVTLEDVRLARGTLIVELCDEAGYTANACGRELMAPAQAGRNSVRFTDVPQGLWAVRILQDYNGNRDMDRNFIGFPKEPFGYSRMTHFPTAEPRFKAIAVSVDRALVTIPVVLLNQRRR